MNWTSILAAAGIPDSPGRAEAISSLVDQQLAASRKREEEQRRADAIYLEKLAAKADTKKAIRSKVRVGR